MRVFFLIATMIRATAKKKKLQSIRRSNPHAFLSRRLDVMHDDDSSFLRFSSVARRRAASFFRASRFRDSKEPESEKIRVINALIRPFSPSPPRSCRRGIKASRGFTGAFYERKSALQISLLAILPFRAISFFSSFFLFLSETTPLLLLHRLSHRASSPTPAVDYVTSRRNRSGNGQTSAAS